MTFSKKSYTNTEKKNLRIHTTIPKTHKEHMKNLTNDPKVTIKHIKAHFFRPLDYLPLNDPFSMHLQKQPKGNKINYDKQN